MNKFEILCDIVILFLDSYQPRLSRLYFFPAWLCGRWHPRFKQVNYLKQRITNIKTSMASAESGESIEDLETREDALITLLDSERYMLSVHTHSHALRLTVQDALLEVLFFEPAHIRQYQKKVLEAGDVAGFLYFLDRTEAIEKYKQYYKKQHAIHGRYIHRFSDAEILLAAKGSMINGQLIERYGIKKMISHGLGYIRRELKSLMLMQSKTSPSVPSVKTSYLVNEAIHGYLEKLDFLLHPANEIQQDEVALIQNARYLLEDIINAVGVDESAKARHFSHQALVTACYWVDDIFKVARGRVDAENLI